MTSDNNYMDLDKIYNTDLKIKYLINNESYLTEEINEAFSDIESYINTNFKNDLLNISSDINSNLKKILQNNIEYEKYVYRKYEEYYNTLNFVENKFDSILDE